MRSIHTIAAALAIIAIAGCSSEDPNYARARQVYKDIVACTDAYDVALEKAATGKEAVAAFNTYQAGVDKANADMNAIVAKTPLLEDKLQPEKGQYDAAIEKAPKLMTKMMTKFEGDPDVVKAVMAFAKEAGMLEGK